MLISTCWTSARCDRFISKPQGGLQSVDYSINEPIIIIVKIQKKLHMSQVRLDFDGYEFTGSHIFDHLELELSCQLRVKMPLFTWKPVVKLRPMQKSGSAQFTCQHRRFQHSSLQKTYFFHFSSVSCQKHIKMNIEWIRMAITVLILMPVNRYNDKPCTSAEA